MTLDLNWLVGNIYVGWEVIRRAENRRTQVTIAVRCPACGRERVHQYIRLMRLDVKACTCLRPVKAIIITHGMSGTAEYRVWGNMKSRCQNINHPDYKDYGGRGITVCEEWQLFINFYKDMGKRPDGFVLDRRDNEKGYYKDNCRWVTQAVNLANRRPYS